MRCFCKLLFADLQRNDSECAKISTLLSLGATVNRKAMRGGVAYAFAETDPQPDAGGPRRDEPCILPRCHAPAQAATAGKIYRRTGNLRAVQLLLGLTQLRRTRYRTFAAVN